MTEIFPEVAYRSRIAEQQFAVAAVSACVVTCQRFSQERVTAAQASGIIVAVAFNGTSRQHALFRPRRANTLIIRRQFFQRMFRQFAVGGQLTAEYRQQRGFAVFIMDIKGVITGNSLRRVGLIITQRTHTGIGPDDIVTAKLFLKCALYTFSR